MVKDAANSDSRLNKPLGLLPLRLEEVSLSVGESVLMAPLSLQITAGSRHLILGSNGAGKSILLRLMHGLLTPTTGKVTWGKDPALGRQAMVFQRPVMLRRSALDNIVFALRVAGMQGDLKQLALDALNRVGLGALAARPARLCSVGEQQRLALARAWAVQPEVLFLDEPSASLDPSATHKIEEIINSMHAEGTTIVMSSHDLAQARRLADRVVFLHGGRLIEESSAQDFFRQPATSMAQAFLRGELVWDTP